MDRPAHWRNGQLAVLQALEVPLFVRRARAGTDPGSAGDASVQVPDDAGWRLQASADQLTALRRQRWYAQLCRYRTPSAEVLADDAAAAIIISGQLLTLEGNPPMPTAEIKRAIYQALRSRSQG